MDDKKVYFINAVVVVSLAALFGILDMTLELGQLHGLVFRLYTFYMLVMTGVVNMGVSLFVDNKRPFLLCMASAWILAVISVAV